LVVLKAKARLVRDSKVAINRLPQEGVWIGDGDQDHPVRKLTMVSAKVMLTKDTQGWEIQVIEGEDTKPGDLLRSNIINLTGLLKLMLGEISSDEEALLDKSLVDVYALKGITMEIVRETLVGAKQARNKILDVMEQAIKAPRESLSSYAPRIHTLKVNPDSIRLIIGPGGKTINEIEKAAKKMKSIVHIISVETREGAQLRDLGKIAAILRYEVHQ